ncbi:MAG: hypothetical protein ACRDLF_15630 [Solirubrobacteraceae bacterium]
MNNVRLPGNAVLGGSLAQRLYTIPITCCVDGQAHDVTDESAAAGHHAGEYQALCGYVVSAAPMIAPVGQPCSRCIAVSVKPQPTKSRPVHRSRHRQTGWLRRMLHPGLAVPG